MKTIELTEEECANAAAIQTAIDGLPSEGGVVQLPAMELILDRGLELRSNIELRGDGKKTILRKAPSKLYPLSGYSNYGMLDVQLLDTEGLTVGMTVSVKDNLRQGFYSTFARITWVEGDWVGLDHGLEADLAATENPRLTTAFPLIFGHGVKNSKITDITLQGDKAENPHAMDGCRGGAVYFLKCDNIEVSGVMECDFNGEGISFQMCSRMVIRNSEFNGNTGNGMHPGAGSTNALFEKCQGKNNDQSGFFFCVRANHISVRGCEFSDNGEVGVSIGARDCFNLIEKCEILENAGPGVLIRQGSVPIEVHSCAIRECRVSGNSRDLRDAQFEINGDAHDVIIEHNVIDGGGYSSGIATNVNVSKIFSNENEFQGCENDTLGAGFTTTRPIFECGCETTKQTHYRHLRSCEKYPS